eukprot:TRINITY_DN90787_c0_g1_i1.p1 TRINITY_DN90787_c0_g1~~TRINITY_DN90787_c0_g1_i1.p1  ORF type:complete len:530 (+),score=102.21 TRINITY_DN90787_c0_g1_i1:61-1650(+)
MCPFFLVSSLIPLLSLAGDAPAQGQVLIQSRLRGSKASVAAGQRYSDDDESCSSEGITPGVCALAFLGRPAQSTSASLFSSWSADNDKRESADRLERALIVEIESALAGNHTGFDAARIRSLEQELKPIFETLPHERSSGDALAGLGLASARYLLHQHFLREHAWYVRGLNPAGDGRKPPSAKEELRSRVAGHLLEVLENKVGKDGLNLKMLAVFVATLEFLIHGDQRERLKQAWLVHSLKAEGTADADTSSSVLRVFMAHYVFTSQKVDSGYVLTLDKGLDEVSTISRIYGGWPNINSFIHGEVAKRKAKRASGELTFEDVSEAADQVLLNFQEVSGAMCRDMEKTFTALHGGMNGSVRHADLINSELGSLFREPKEYLVSLGALDETLPDGPHLLMPNYMLGPSNCDGTTSFYDLCCPNDCEAHKMQLERALMEAGNPLESVKTVVQQRLASTIPDDLLKHLHSLVQANQGQLLIHGRGFAEWLHKVFPRECPKPREADFKGMAGDTVPDANTDFQATATSLSSIFS